MNPFFFTLTLFFNTAYATPVALIPLSDKDGIKRPANDLVYQGARIDENEAAELKKNGVDLSRLNPKESELWKDVSTSVEVSTWDAPSPNETFELIGYLSAPVGYFRANIQSVQTQKIFTLTFALETHGAIIRAGLLKKMGYQIDSPQYYKNLKLRFATVDAKKKFLTDVSVGTRTKEERWVSENIETVPQMSFKGGVLEPARLKTLNVHWGFMSRTREQDRRVFRALFLPYVIGDFTEKVNSFEWEVGSIFDEKVQLPFFSAAAFVDVTFDDASWALKRLSALTRKDFESVIARAGLPEDISKLLVEKIISRRNRLFLLFLNSNDYEKISFDGHLTAGNVISGKLTDFDDKGYAGEFYEKDPLSPYRASEMFRYFGTQAVFSLFSGGLNQLQTKFIPQLTEDTAAANILQNKATYFAKADQLGDGTKSFPIKTWISPFASGNLTASRAIVFGQVLGSNAPIQIVDTFGVQGNVGTVAIPIQGFTPQIGVGLTLGRTYSHVRAIADMSAATHQPVDRILVPHFMKKLSRALVDDPECTLATEPYVVEEVIDEETFFKIRYDKNLENGLALAKVLREKTIADGKDEAKIFFEIFDRNEECLKETQAVLEKTVSDFLKTFALNEVFAISDSLTLTGKITAPVIPVKYLSQLSLGNETQTALLRMIVIRRTASGFEVSYQFQKTGSTRMIEKFDQIIPILQASQKILKGDVKMENFKITLDDDTSVEEKKKAIKALIPLFSRASLAEVREAYQPFVLDHTIKQFFSSFQFLWWKADRLTQSQEVEISLPEIKTASNEDRSKYQRNLFSLMSVKRRGRDLYGFFSQILSKYVSFLNLGGGSLDPGYTLYGKSFKKYVITDSELTEGREENIMTRVLQVWNGFETKPEKLDQYFTEIETNLRPFLKPGQTLIDRSEFYQTRKVRSYEVRATYLIYPSALLQLSHALLSSREEVAIHHLKKIYGESDWKSFCEHAIGFFGDTGPQRYSSLEKEYACLPPVAQKVFELRRTGLNKDRRKKTKQFHQLIEAFFDETRAENFLSFIGKENFLFSARVTGFRTLDPKGYLDLVSDTVGYYQPDMGTGIFDQISSLLGVSSYDLRALILTPGLYQ